MAASKDRRYVIILYNMCRDSSVDIETHYELVGSGIEFAHPGGRAV
jgi:hypothetical protein